MGFTLSPKNGNGWWCLANGWKVVGRWAEGGWKMVEGGRKVVEGGRKVVEGGRKVVEGGRKVGRFTIGSWIHDGFLDPRWVHRFMIGSLKSV